MRTKKRKGSRRPRKRTCPFVLGEASEARRGAEEESESENDDEPERATPRRMDDAPAAPEHVERDGGSTAEEEARVEPGQDSQEQQGQDEPGGG